MQLDKYVLELQKASDLESSQIICTNSKFKTPFWLPENVANLKIKLHCKNTLLASSLTNLPHAYLCCWYQLYFQQEIPLYIHETLLLQCAEESAGREIETLNAILYYCDSEIDWYCSV